MDRTQRKRREDGGKGEQEEEVGEAEGTEREESGGKRE